MGTIHMLQLQPMEALSQLDIQSPDHVSVITKDGKMTVSVVKDGATVTVSMPVLTVFDTTPRPPLQQPAPKVMAVKYQETTGSQPRNYPLQRKRKLPQNWVSPTTKLSEAEVREIKMMVSDEELISRLGTLTKAYEEIGRAYSVSGCTVSNIARGVSWKHVTI